MRWRTIKSAPKDGQTILVVNEGHVVTVAWRYDDRWGAVWGKEDYVQDGSIDDTALIARNPTHWMPLPNLPKDEQ